MFISKADVLKIKDTISGVVAKQLILVENVRSLETRLNDLVPGHEIQMQSKRLEKAEEEIDNIEKSVADARENIAEQKGILSAIQSGGSRENSITIHNTPISGNDTQLNQAQNLSNVSKESNDG